MSHDEPAVAPRDIRSGGNSSPGALSNVGGTVKWFDPRKGFGFLVGPQGQDVFVHFSVIEQSSGFRTLRDGEEVVYSAHEGPKGWTASFVRAIAKTSESDGVSPRPPRGPTNDRPPSSGGPRRGS